MDVGPFDFGADFGAITLGRRIVDRWQTRYRIRALAIAIDCVHAIPEKANRSTPTTDSDTPNDNSNLPSLAMCKRLCARTDVPKQR